MPLQDNTAPLSVTQERMWFLWHLEPDNPSYNLTMAWRLTGDLNAGAMNWALQEVVRRQKILRTSFSDDAGTPVQVINDRFELKVSRLDLVTCDGPGQAARLEEVCKQYVTTPFDLTQGPPIRVLLVRLRDDEHVMAFVIHHILADGWSLAIFFREVSLLYDAYLTRKPYPLPSLKKQFHDFAIEQRRRMQTPEMARSIRYWVEQLSGLQNLQLHTVKLDSSAQTFRGRRESFSFTTELSRKIRHLARQEGVTLFMALLCSFQLLLSRYVNQHDIAVGTPMAGRDDDEVSDLVGYFVNMVVIRSRFHGDPTVRAALRGVRETCLKAYTHQEVPFARLVQILNPERAVNQNPLFRVNFALQNTPITPVELTGLSVQELRLETGAAQLDLDVSVWEAGESLSGWLEYKTDLFGPATIRRLIHHWMVMVEGMVAEAGRHISELPMLTPEERAQLAVYSRGQEQHSLGHFELDRSSEVLNMMSRRDSNGGSGGRSEVVLGPRFVRRKLISMSDDAEEEL